MTKTEKIIDFLKSRGLKEIKSKSRKYRTFVSQSGTHYYVGKAGAVRRGRTCSDSVSITDGVIANMRKQGIII